MSLRLLEHDFELDAGLCHVAASGGHLTTLQYILQHNGGQFFSDTIDAAAAHGHLHILQWLNTQVDSHPVNSLLIGPSRHTSVVAALNGHVHVLDWIAELFDIDADPCLYQACALSAHDIVKKWASQRNTQRYEDGKQTVQIFGGIITIRSVWW